MVQKDCLNNKIIIICGPTASGKTALAISLAKKLNGEIISADSMNVYKGLDVGTAKPTISEQQEITHHLIDVVSPFDTFSVGDYRELALPIVENLLKKGKIPIIVGGTGFYINSILYNLSYGNTPENLQAREKYNKMLETEGIDSVYNVLLKVDPISAQKIHKNDTKRVIRALEIYESGVKKSEIKDDLTPRFNYSAFMIDYPREILYDRIDLRVDLMVKNGLIDEVQSLINSGVTLDNQSMQGIGYKELYSYLTGQSTLDEAIEQIKLNTRHYAKRQITFFKKLPNLVYLQPDTLENLTKTVMENL